MARRKKVKKENKEKKTGFQLMITDYFKHTKPIVKTEKVVKHTSVPVKDVLQSVQYEFDQSAVPKDDDLEVLEVIPAKDTTERKAVPFVYVIPDDDEPVKVEPKEEMTAMETVLVTFKSEPQPDNPVDGDIYLPIPPTNMMESIVGHRPDGEVNSESVSLEQESTREDNMDEPNKVSAKEQLLLKQVESLTKGLEDIKNQMRREKMVSAKHTLAAKVRQKMFKPKLGHHKRKPIFESAKSKPE